MLLLVCKHWCILDITDSFVTFSAIFKAELQAIISACREMRLHVDKICSNLINQAVTIMPVSMCSSLSSVSLVTLAYSTDKNFKGSQQNLL